jgi:hypothetical protein
VTSTAIVNEEEFTKVIRIGQLGSDPAAPRLPETEESVRESPNAFRTKLPPITTATIRIAMSAPNHG